MQLVVEYAPVSIMRCFIAEMPVHSLPGNRREMATAGYMAPTLLHFLSAKPLGLYLQTIGPADSQISETSPAMALMFPVWTN